MALSEAAAPAFVRDSPRSCVESFIYVAWAPRPRFISRITWARGAHATDHTSQIFAACASDVIGSRAGTNSWPTYPLKPVSTIARITAG